MARSQTRLVAEIDFERNGKQHARAAAAARPGPERVVSVRPRQSSPSGHAEADVIRLAVLALALAATPIATNAQTTEPREPRSCQQLHEEMGKCEAGMRSCDQHVSTGCRRSVNVMRSDCRRYRDHATADARRSQQKTARAA
jgi:hypothetical protein